MNKPNAEQGKTSHINGACAGPMLRPKASYGTLRSQMLHRNSFCSLISGCLAMPTVPIQVNEMSQSTVMPKRLFPRP